MPRTSTGALRRLCLALALLLAAAAPAMAQRGPTTPAPGSPERRAIMDAIRAATREDLEKPVIFVVDHLKVQDNYAFMMGVPRKPDGTPFDYSGTLYQEQIEGGAFDDWIYAVLAKINGRWQVLEWLIGATDVAWLGAVGKYGAPETIFPEHGDEHDHH